MSVTIKRKSEMAKFITSMLAGVLRAGKLPRILNTIQLPPIATTPKYSANQVVLKN